MFKVGDVCELIRATSYPRMLGAECVVVEQHPWTPAGHVTFTCVDFPPPSGYPVWQTHPKNLRLKRPPTEYDGNQAGDWSLIPWAPKRERVS